MTSETIDDAEAREEKKTVGEEKALARTVALLAVTSLLNKRTPVRSPRVSRSVPVLPLSFRHVDPEQRVVLRSA